MTRRRITAEEYAGPPREVSTLDQILAAQASLEPIPGAVRIPLEKLQPNPENPRTRVQDAELADLAESLAVRGQLQPCRVIAGERPGSYIVIAGSRRLLAARTRQSEIPTLDCVVVEASRHEAFADALVENLQRVNLDRRETLRAVARMNAEFGWSAREIAKRLGRHFTDTAELLRIATDDRLMPLVEAGKVNPSVAGQVVTLPRQAREEFVAQIEAGMPPTVMQVRQHGTSVIPELRRATRALLAVKSFPLPEDSPDRQEFIAAWREVGTWLGKARR